MIKIKNNLIIYAGAILLIFSIGIFIYANSKDKNNNENTKINIIVSILPQIDFVENIGKDKVSVSSMILPGFSPAAYEPNIE